MLSLQSLFQGSQTSQEQEPKCDSFALFDKIYPIPILPLPLSPIPSLPLQNKSSVSVEIVLLGFFKNFFFVFFKVLTKLSKDTTFLLFLRGSERVGQRGRAKGYNLE